MAFWLVRRNAGILELRSALIADWSGMGPASRTDIEDLRRASVCCG
jgi:hypothetical protein